MSNETVKNAVKSLSDMKDDTVTLAASIVAIMISLIALLAYMYVSGTFFFGWIKCQEL